MEHPLRVDEFSPSEMPPRPATEPAAPELSFSATAVATLPPLPSLAADEVLFLRPSDRRYAEFLAAASKRRQLSPALRAVCNTGVDLPSVANLGTRLLANHWIS